MAAATETDQREQLSGDRAQRIVDAMRRSVAERGIAASTFEVVAAEAEVSRGLLHYYFGTKERLLVEVARSDADLRVSLLAEPLGRASDRDEMLEVIANVLEGLLREDSGFFTVMYELFGAGRRTPEIKQEVAEVYRRSRDRIAEALEEKRGEGVISLALDAAQVAAIMIGLAEGLAIQVLSDPSLEVADVVDGASEVAACLICEA